MPVASSNPIAIRCQFAWLTCLCCAMLVPPARADEAPVEGDKPSTIERREGLEFFEARIRPVLVEQCYACHSSNAKRVQGGLLLDTRESVLKGGDSGPALTPGHPEDSLLLEAIRYAGLEMPPNRKLPESVAADFEKWIRMGAPDPRKGGAASAEAAGGKRAKRATRAVEPLWAFQPVARPAVPSAPHDDWSRSPVDRFILAKLKEKNLAPTSDAPRETLVRRVYLDLTGLPPTGDEVEAFGQDIRPDAFEFVVNRLLDSPQFGERWGRHWLDVARYADSSGGGRARIFENAWRYRDYVIDSFNVDKPFDRFVAEQIAGDLLPHAIPQERAENLIATGFLALGPTNYEAQDKELLRMDVVDEQIDTTGRAFLALTLGCARCHDHKFDPISTKEYYALAGIFRSTKTLVHANISDWIERELPADEELRHAHDEHNRKTGPLQSQLKQAKDRLKALTSSDVKAKSDNSPAQLGEVRAEIQQLESRLKQLQLAAPVPLPRTMSVEEEEHPCDFQVCIRGNVHTLGDQVPRGFLSFASSVAVSKIADKQSGRMELAAWIGNGENPLTARVIVNRIWLHLMGAGIVQTPDNFGNAGELPSHPELLDWLARDFMDHGWSIKHTVRQIVCSRVYRLSTTASADALAADPENRLWSHMNRRRLDAEVLRDAMLLASGLLDTTPGGPSVAPGTVSEFDYEYKSFRRSVYVPVLRNELLDLFELFDVADPNLVGGHRNTSTTATQALYLANSPFVMDCALEAARRMLSQPAVDDSHVVDTAYQRVLGRMPTDNERQACRQFLSEAAATEAHAGDEARLKTVARLFQTLFACIDFRYIE